MKIEKDWVPTENGLTKRWWGQILKIDWYNASYDKNYLSQEIHIRRWNRLPWHETLANIEISVKDLELGRKFWENSFQERNVK